MMLELVWHYGTYFVNELFNQVV